MKKTMLLLLTLLLNSSVMMAQMSPKVITKFPAHIVYRLNSITSKIKIGEEKQLKIGAELLKRDSLANAGLAKGETIEKSQTHYVINKNEFSKFLTQEEIELYYSQGDPNNRLLLAVTLAKELKLEPNQLTALRKQNNTIDSLKIEDIATKHKLYARKLDSILTKKQKTFLIAKIYRKDAHTQTTKDWEAILKYKLATVKDSSLIIPQIYRSNLARFCITDPKMNKNKNKKPKELSNQAVFNAQPPIQNHLYILQNKNYRKNLFATLIQLTAELKLNPVQIDSLLTNYKKLELIKFKDNKTPTIKSKNHKEYTLIENNVMTQILDSNQLTAYLYKKNRDMARDISLYNWTQLEKNNLTTGLDKSKTITELVSYQWSSLVAGDRIKISNNRMNLLAKRDLELKKPDLLKQLDIIKQTESNTKSIKNELKM